MNCIGKIIAYIALKLAVAHLLFQYDIRQAGKETGGGGNLDDPEEGRHREGEYQMRDWILAFRDGPFIELRNMTT